MLHRAASQARRDSGEQLDFLIVHREHGPAGITGLNEFSARDLRCMVGTWFGRRFWGTGANRESKALDRPPRLRRARACTAWAPTRTPTTSARRRALLGVGFRHEGVLRHWHRHGDDYYDVNVFGMLRADWETGPLAACR